MSVVHPGVESARHTSRFAGTLAAPANRSFNVKLLQRLLRWAGNPPLELALASGELARGPGTEMVARVTLRDRATLLGVLADPLVRFGDAYSEGQLEISGDLVGLMELAYRAAADGAADSIASRALTRLRRPRKNSLAGSRENIHRHYDIGNDFYALWLGSTLAYTCAYYPTAQATLDEAQIAKFDHVARKLRLRPGESVVEAGCGWGGLALHLARRYGVKVRAFNISKEQIAWARDQAARSGLENRVEFIDDDYRNIAGRYDAFVSVGMLEHVGLPNYPELGRVISRCLPAHGRGLIHSIGRNRPAPLHPWIEKRIFPGAYAPSLGEMARIFEPQELSVLDVENLRLHYAQTLRHWLALYEREADRVRAMFDEKFVRMWRLYLAGSIAAFNTGALQLFQVVFAPQRNNALPLTRDHLYGDRAWPADAGG
ncbi:MAG: cyclopropane-fatty-acyl-phospholipid synthase family protein [Steroidobacteraceae bacterium]